MRKIKLLGLKTWGAIAGLAMGLAACTAVHPVSSASTAATLILKAPYTDVAPPFQTTLPAGKYHVAWEDDKGYYYEAPTNLITTGTLTSAFDGGVYVSKKTHAPTHFYTVIREGEVMKYKLEKVPPYELGS